MIDRLEVNPGPGTVIRYGSLVAWVAPAASSGLVSFLAVSARNLAGSPAAGQQLADHLTGVLEERDPEPHVAFAVVGPSAEGWVALLHGPVQVWDGASWVSPDQARGWIRTALWPRPSLAVTSAGASAPAVHPDALWDLEAGVVPGQGFVLVPAVPSASAGPVPDLAGPAEAERTQVLDTGTPPPVGAQPLRSVPGPAEPDPEEDPATVLLPEPVPAGEPGTPQPTPAREDATPTPAGTVAPAVEPDTGPRAEPEPVGPDRIVDLGSAAVRSRLVAYPPLPRGVGSGRAAPGAPVVAGTVCPRGHLNRPGVGTCVRCGTPISAQEAYTVTGTRPALGCLVLDDGSVYRLDSGYLAGSDPARDPTVRGGLARPLVLAGDQVAPSHAEIRLHDWDVVVTDRDSPGGTFVFGPDSVAWERLRPYEPRVLTPGTHIAIGQRVATFLTAWLATGGAPVTDPAR